MALTTVVPNFKTDPGAKLSNRGLLPTKSAPGTYLCIFASCSSNNENHAQTRVKLPLVKPEKHQRRATCLIQHKTLK